VQAAFDNLALLSKSWSEALREPQTVETLRQQMMEPAPSTPGEFARFMSDELHRWQPVIEKNNIKAD
jgi:tripartite-type tricarboxylate transporter receptor subunit TctC